MAGGSEGAGSALLLPGEPRPGASWGDAGFGTQLLHQLLPLRSQRLGSPPTSPFPIHAGAYSWGEQAVLCPPLPRAATLPGRAATSPRVLVLKKGGCEDK